MQKKYRGGGIDSYICRISLLTAAVCDHKCDHQIRLALVRRRRVCSSCATLWRSLVEFSAVSLGDVAVPNTDRRTDTRAPALDERLQLRVAVIPLIGPPPLRRLGRSPTLPTAGTSAIAGSSRGQCVAGGPRPAARAGLPAARGAAWLGGTAPCCYGLRWLPSSSPRPTRPAAVPVRASRPCRHCLC